MKKFLTFLLAGMLIVAVTAPVFAWEFTMKGEYEFRLRYFARLGDKDLFGVASTQDGLITNLLGAGGVSPVAAPAPATQFVGFAGPNKSDRSHVVL